MNSLCIEYAANTHARHDVLRVLFTLPAGGHGRCRGTKVADQGRAYVVSGDGKAKALPLDGAAAAAAFGLCRSSKSVCTVPGTTDAVRN